MAPIANEDLTLTQAAGPVSKGQCLCGAVKFELTGKSRFSAMCHCVDCKRWTGSNYMPFDMFEKTQLHMVQGADQLRELETKADSGASALRNSCATCGTPVLMYKTADEAVVIITAGTRESRDLRNWAPTWEFFNRSKLAFLPTLKGSKVNNTMPKMVV